MSEVSDLREELKDDFKRIAEDISALRVEVGKKVSWTFFLTSLFSLIGLQLTISMIMYNEIKEIRNTSVATEQGVARIEGKLSPFDFILKP